MPTYEYECSLCGHAFEIFQSVSEKRLKDCPECKKSGLERLIGTGSGIIFKGKGFYATDYQKSQPISEKTAEGSTKKPACSKDCCQKSCPANPQNSSK